MIRARPVSRPDKRLVPPAAPVIPGSDHDALTHAYKTGLISGWRLDAEGRYRITLADNRDDFIEMAKLTAHLAHLRKSSAIVKSSPTPARPSSPPR